VQTIIPNSPVLAAFFSSFAKKKIVHGTSHAKIELFLFVHSRLPSGIVIKSLNISAYNFQGKKSRGDPPDGKCPTLQTIRRIIRQIGVENIA